ncbi:MAG: hypothetical protein QOJ66_3732 [Ilumatobacteraceae bacterium]|jgi:hypothetical protein
MTRVALPATFDNSRLMYWRLCGAGLAVRLTWLAPVIQIVVVGRPQGPDEHYVLCAERRRSSALGQTSSRRADHEMFGRLAGCCR